MTGLPERLVRERDLILDVVGERWKRALLASVGEVDARLRRAARRAGGRRRPHPRCRSILLAYFVAQLLAQIPITPGGLGFVEAGLTGTLALVGVAGRRRRRRDARLPAVLLLAADPGRRRRVLALPPPLPGIGDGRPGTRPDAASSPSAPTARAAASDAYSSSQTPSRLTPGTDGTPITRMPGGARDSRAGRRVLERDAARGLDAERGGRGEVGVGRRLRRLPSSPAIVAANAPPSPRAAQRRVDDRARRVRAQRQRDAGRAQRAEQLARAGHRLAAERQLGEQQARGAAPSARRRCSRGSPSIVAILAPRPARRCRRARACARA